MMASFSDSAISVHSSGSASPDAPEAALSNSFRHRTKLCGESLTWNDGIRRLDRISPRGDVFRNRSSEHRIDFNRGDTGSAGCNDWTVQPFNFHPKLLDRLNQQGRPHPLTKLF